jgi:hypothetical protein
MSSQFRGTAANFETILHMIKLIDGRTYHLTHSQIARASRTWSDRIQGIITTQMHMIAS